MVPSNNRVTQRGIGAQFGPQPCHEIPPGGYTQVVCIWFILLHAFQKNGCIDFPPVFKLSFIQKYLLGMPNLCPQGQPWPGRLLSPPTAAVPCAWHHPAKKCATYREQLWCTFLISSHGKSQEQPGLLHPLNETEMPCHWDFWTEPIPAHKGVRRNN